MPERKLIYADTAVEKLAELILLGDYEKQVINLFVDQCMAVDAVPVVHGTWENEQIGFMYYDAACSVCKNHNKSASNYCPYCGAKMDGVSDG